MSHSASAFCALGGGPTVGGSIGRKGFVPPSPAGRGGADAVSARWHERTSHSITASARSRVRDNFVEDPLVGRGNSVEGVGGHALASAPAKAFPQDAIVGGQADHAREAVEVAALE